MIYRMVTGDRMVFGMDGRMDGRMVVGDDISMCGMGTNAFESIMHLFDNIFILINTLL
jgi:hypothetical protein